MNTTPVEARLRVPRRLANLAESLMLGQGALAVTLTDQGDTPLLEPGVGETPLWDDVVVTGLFPADADRGRVSAALSLLPVAAPEFESTEDRAWERAWMDRFQPMRFGASLWIVPTGQEPPEPDADILRLDPGLAFGTGTHPTTRLCLEWLDGRDLGGLEVIDFGCGSGVLGLAAALRGARRVRCVDHDPQAVSATLENARRNGLGERIAAARGDAPGAPAADLVIANILAGVLVRLAPSITAAVRPGGRLVLSGILEEQGDAVAAAFAGDFPAFERRSLDGWMLLSGQRVG